MDPWAQGPGPVGPLAQEWMLLCFYKNMIFEKNIF